jgi:hypothetical protein
MVEMTNDDIRAQLALIRGAADTIAAGLVDPPSTETAIHVKQGGDVQAAIDQAVAKGGVEVLIEPGTYPGPWFVRGRPAGSPTITIRPDIDMSRMPLPGTRVTAPAAVTVAPIAGSNLGIGTDLGARGYLLWGLGVSSPGLTGTLLAIASAAARLEDVPSDIVVASCWLDGGNACKRGIQVDGARIAVTDSAVFGVAKLGQDTQAIGGAKGPGPFSILNNFLSASGETVLFGGDDPIISALIPSNILIRGNTITKDRAWQKTATSPATGEAKNCLELKNAQHVLIEGNIIENSWSDGQDGHLVLITVRNQNGGAPWSTVSDVEMRYNVCRHGNMGLSVLALDDIVETLAGKAVPIGTVRPSVRASNLRFHDNLWYDLARPGFGGGVTRALFVNNGPLGLQITHETMVGPVSAGLALTLGVSKTPAAGLVVRDCILPEGNYGITGDSTTSPGVPAWTASVDAASVFDNNQMVKTQNARTIKYPGAKTTVGPVTFDAGFGSTPAMVGSDGLAVGADLAKIQQAIPGLDLTQ